MLYSNCLLSLLLDYRYLIYNKYFNILGSFIRLCNWVMTFLILGIIIKYINISSFGTLTFILGTLTFNI